MIDFSIIWKKIHLNEVDKDDEKQFRQWLNISDRQTTFYKQAKQYYAKGSGLKQNELSPLKGYASLMRRIQYRRIYKLVSSVAAILGLVISISIYINYSNNQPELFSEQAIAPGTDKATLILGNGSEVALSEATELNLNEQGIQVRSKGNSLHYEAPRIKNQKKIAANYNTLKIPRGGKYFVILSDSTKVWLNSDSKLRYPVTFSSSERQVELEGEAFFEVTKDHNRPFLVKSNQQEIRVLGTSFNVRVYDDEQLAYTTLVEGSVEVKYRNTEDGHLQLKPSEQAVIDHSVQNALIRKVNSQDYIAWRDGVYFFNNERIEDILRTLSRWYDTEVVFQNEQIKDMRFTGSFNRTQYLNDIITIIEQTQKIKITAYENKLIVN